MTPPQETPFQQIDNPYFTGNPVRGSKVFFGREDDFDYLEQRLISESEGIVLLFVGGRRSGKTSIMFQILDGRLGPDFLPVFIDMQQMAGVNNDSEFLLRLAQVTLERAQDDRLVPDYYDFSSGNPILTLDRLLEDIGQVFSNRRLVFLVDEAEILRDKVAAGEISGAVLTYLASALESRGVSFLFTGSSGLAVGEESEWRRLIGKSDYREITFLSRGDTDRLVQEPVEGDVSYDHGVVDEIFKLTYGHPFYTQVICTGVVDHLNGTHRNNVSREDLDEVVDTIVNNPPPQLVYDWDQFSDQEKQSLSLLSEVTGEAHRPVQPTALLDAIKQNKYPVDLRADTLNVVLDSLDERKVLERADDGGVHFLVDLVRLWIRRNRSIWRLVEESELLETPRPRWPWVAAAAVAIGLMTAAAWVFRQPEEPRASVQPLLPGTGVVHIAGFPQGATVFLDGEPRGTTPTLTSLPDVDPGTRVVSVEHPLFRTFNDTIEVAAGRWDTVVAAAREWVRLTGSLAVGSTPAGASALVKLVGSDWETTSSTPIADLALPTGAYEVSLSKPGYRPQKKAAEIRDGESQHLDFALEPNVGKLHVISEPAGAHVELDGVFVGSTPLPIDSVTTGPHKLSLSLQDYDESERQVMVHFGRTESLHVDLNITAAVFTVRSDPAGAAVYVDGADDATGLTPLPLTMKPGPHRLEIALEGYDSVLLTPDLKPGEERMESVSLVQQFGIVRIPKPLSATLYVDGDLHKTGILRNVKLPVGPHTLEIDGVAKQVYIVKDSTIIEKWK